jgi:hypothetical protein
MYTYTFWWDDSQRASGHFKIKFFKNRAITKKGFLLGHSVRNSNVHPVDANGHMQC